MQASVRAKLQDPLYAGFFLPFAKTPPFKNGSYHVTKCGAEKNRSICSDLYHDLVDTQLPGAVRVSPDRAYGWKPGGKHYAMCDGDCDCGSVPCAEFVYDHRNGSMLTNWLIDEYVGGPFGTGSPHVNGVFLDDYWCAGPTCNQGEGPTEMEANKRTDMGLSDSDVVAITKGWYENQARVQMALLRDNKYNWNLVPGRPPFPDGVGCGPAVTVFPDSCPGKPGCASGNTAYPCPLAPT